MRLDNCDYHVALEYAFLCYETKQRAEARRVFDRIRREGDPNRALPPSRPFRTSTSRSPKASPAGRRPSNFHLAISAPTRNSRALPKSVTNSALAAEHYQAAWRCGPICGIASGSWTRMERTGRTENSNPAPPCSPPRAAHSPGSPNVQRRSVLRDIPTFTNSERRWSWIRTTSNCGANSLTCC